MVFFKRKNHEAEKPKKGVRTPSKERVLTAEGWHRRALKKTKA